MSPYPHVRIEGGPRERGRQYGEQTRELVHRSLESYEAAFERIAGWDWRKVTAEARRFEEPIADYEPTYLEEIQGIAEGAGVDAADALALNVRTEIMFSARAREAARLPGFVGVECSSFAVLPEATADGRTFVGQNWDWIPDAVDRVVVVEARQDDGPDYVTVVEAGLLAKMGFNSSGVGVAANALVTDADAGEPAVPFHVLLRAILDCETISDALEALQRRPRASSANYMIAHRDGIAVDAETAPGDFSRIHLLFPTNGRLAHTNHFLSAGFQGKDVTIWLAPSSPFRLERIRAALARSRPVTVEALQRALSEHVNYPSSVCCHPDTRVDFHDRAITAASVIMDLDGRRMWLADGNPCTTPYRELDYSEFLEKESPLRAAGAEAAVA